MIPEDTGARRVAVFGGSFNPPHVAHVFAALYAVACEPVDLVLVVPVYKHPFAKELAPFDDRLEMCRLGLGYLPGVEVSTVERELDGESKTLRTIEHLVAAHPDWSLRLLVGADVLQDLPKWHRFDRIAEIAPPLVLGRRGFASSGSGLAAGHALLPEISSTDVRAAIREGRIADVRADVPRAVLDYIEAHRLYGARVAERRRAVFVLGAGKVGAGLARALARAGYSVTLRAARRGLPARRIDADVIIVAVRDRDIAPAAAALVARRLIGHRPVAVLHCAGALGPDALAAARSKNVAVAQMHPMISFASTKVSPSLADGQLHVDGDPAAMRAARAIGKRLGMKPRTIAGLDRVAYHAAAGLVANGAAALAAGGVALLDRAGVDAKAAAAMLGPLLRSVAENVTRLGLPRALTGPVRRGDATGLGKHLETIQRLAPELVALYVAASATQLPLARALAEAPDASFDAIRDLLEQWQKNNPR